MTFTIVQLDPTDVEIGDILIAYTPEWTEEDIVSVLGQDIFDALHLAGAEVDEDWVGAVKAVMTRSANYHVHGTVTIEPQYLDESRNMVKIICDNPILTDSYGPELAQITTSKMLYNVGYDYAYVLRPEKAKSLQDYQSDRGRIPPEDFKRLFEGRFEPSPKQNNYGNFKPRSTGRTEE